MEGIYICVSTKSLQLCPTLCDPMDCVAHSSVRGFFQARILEWVVISYSRICVHRADSLHCTAETNTIF